MLKTRGVCIALGTVVLLGSTACGSDEGDDGASSTSNTGTPASSAASGTGGSGEASSGAGAEGATGGASDGGGGSAAVGGAGGSVGNQAPVVAILQPADGSTVTVGTNVAMEAAITDAEDGTLPNRSIFWEGAHGAIIDPIGQGPTIAYDLTDATDWTLTVTATDSGGLSTSASVTVHVTE